MSHSRIMTEPEFQLRSAPEPWPHHCSHTTAPEILGRKALGKFNHLEQNRETRNKPKGPLEMKDKVAEFSSVHSKRNSQQLTLRLLSYKHNALRGHLTSWFRSPQKVQSSKTEGSLLQPVALKTIKMTSENLSNVYLYF